MAMLPERVSLARDLSAHSVSLVSGTETPDPTPAGVKGWKLTAIGSRANDAVVSLEEPGVRGGGTSHLLLPLGGFCRANDPAICNGLATALVLYSSSAVEATTVSLTAAEVARCLLLRAKGGGERTESSEFRGGSIWLHRLKDNIGLLVVENQHATKTARVGYDGGGRNVTCSRGAAKTVDTIAPGHFQVLRVDSELDHAKGWSFQSSMTMDSYVHDEARGADHVHVPHIEASSIHCEFPM